MSKITHQITRQLALDLVKNTDNFLFDCDGVLWHSDQVIPGCPETLQKLKQMGKRIFFVTNNSSKTRESLVAKCHKFGYPADIDSIVCTANSAAMYLKNMNFTGKVYLVGNKSMASELDAVGIKYEGLGPDPLKSGDSDFDEIMKYQREWKPDPEINCVLVGFDPHLSYVKMIKAATYARQKNNLFLATNEDPFLPTKEQIVMPGTGSIVHAIKTPARREPHVIGKPGTAMFDLLHENHGIDASRSVMVGDVLKTDISMAVNCEMKSILVLSGADDLQHVEANQQSDDPKLRHIVPDYYVESFAKIGEYIADL